MTEKQYNDWYKKQFNSLNTKPPVEVWNNISNKLDVQDVWKGVDSKLNFITRRKIILRSISYSLLLLFLLVFLRNYIVHYGRSGENETVIANKSDEKSKIKNSFVSNNHEKFQRETNRQTNSSSKNNKAKKNQPVVYNSAVSHTRSESQTDILNPTELSSVKVNEFDFKTSELKTQNESFMSNNSSTEKTNILKTENQHFLGFNEPIVTENIVRDSTNIKSESTTQVAILFESKILPNTNTKNYTAELLLFPINISFIPVNISDSIIPQLVLNNYNADSSDCAIQPSLSNGFHGWYVGGIVSVNNTWLFNQLAFDGLSSNSLEQTNLNFGYAYGASFGYNFNSQQTVEMNWYINSQQGQTYHLYNEGQYQTSRVKLNYSIVNLTLKHRKDGISKWFSVPKSHNLNIGINCGFLTKSDNTMEQEGTKSFYSSVDYGLRLGYEYEILAFKRIIFSSTLNGDFGLKNIYKGNSSTPGNFNRTHTASLGLQLRVKYIFR